MTHKTQPIAHAEITVPISADLRRIDDAGAQPAPITLMTEDRACKWAWDQVREDVGTKGWTAGDSGNFYGFFLWGWNYRGQYETQRLAAPPAPAAVAVPAEPALVPIARLKNARALIDRGFWNEGSKILDEMIAAAPAQEHATQLAGHGQWKEQGYVSAAHYAEDMQAVGEALMEAIKVNYAALQAAGWSRPADCPSEIVADLLDLIAEAKAAPAQAQEDARNLETEALRACRDLPEGWEIEIHLERGYGVVTVIDPQGNDDELPVEGTLFDALKETIDTAIRDDAARAAQGGA